MSMDTTKVFDTLERKIERLLARLKSLEAENEKLKADLNTARKAEKDAGDSKGVMEKLERERDLVRQRLEKLIHSLESAEGKA
jgi:FtsZ-binding cell division protein ZapB